MAMGLEGIMPLPMGRPKNLVPRGALSARDWTSPAQSEIILVESRRDYERGLLEFQ